MQPIRSPTATLLRERFVGNIEQRLNGTYNFQYRASATGRVTVNGEVVLGSVLGPSIRNFSITLEAQQSVEVEMEMDGTDEIAEFSQSLVWKLDDSDQYVHHRHGNCVLTSADLCPSIHPQ